MNAADLLKLPVAPAQPQRSDLDVLIDDAWHRLAFAETPESAQLWQSRHDEMIARRSAP